MKSLPVNRAFTLVELLVTTGILAILASLIMAALASAKAKARQAQCLGNLRQHGIGLSSFLADHHEYPLAMSANVQEQYPHHRRTWQGALFPDLLDQRDVFMGEPKVFDCPSASLPPEFPPHQGYMDYGYNAWGLGGVIMKPLLGLGGKGLGIATDKPLLEADYPPPVAESEIVNPTGMLAMGDGFNGWKGVIRDGGWVLGRGPDAQEFYGSTARSPKRHKARANAVFADAHAETLTLKFLFGDNNDQALQIWNRDNQPHRERLAQ